jgi:hypothetical protein
MQIENPKTYERHKRQQALDGGGGVQGALAPDMLRIQGSPEAPATAADSEGHANDPSLRYSSCLNSSTLFVFDTTLSP